MDIKFYCQNGGIYISHQVKKIEEEVRDLLDAEIGLIVVKFLRAEKDYRILSDKLGGDLLLLSN